MHRALFSLPALLLAGAAVAQNAERPNALDPRAKTPPLQYQSAFDGYRPFAEQELRDWRRANDAVRDAGGHAGHQPGQGAGQPASKPQPGTPEGSGHQGHGAHK